jgi:hypothetical protein
MLRLAELDQNIAIPTGRLEFVTSLQSAGVVSHVPIGDVGRHMDPSFRII